jgi:hypothetical protein
MSDAFSADRLRGALDRLVSLVTATTAEESRLKTALEQETIAA